MCTAAVTIPAELMLPEQRLSRYLGYFFTHIHPTFLFSALLVFT